MNLNENMIFKTFLKHFFKHDFRFKSLIFPIIHLVSAFTLSLLEYDNKELFNVQFLPAVSIYSSVNSLENKETCQLDGVKLTQQFIL